MQTTETVTPVGHYWITAFPGVIDATIGIADPDCGTPEATE